ncbi:uncharacterized protein LOC144665240 isoform X1 [Oculina patagonica]
MADKELLFIPVLLLLCQIFYGEATQECTEAEYSKFGMMLRRHIFKKIMGVSLSGLCLVDCYQDVRCQSFNYVISKYMCEFNNRTKEARPEDYVPDPDRLYFRRDMNRVLLGSIPELPAETCREIKLSEGGQAVSDKYWFDSIIPGKTVLAHCDMKKEDLDECSSSIPVCDVNANCKNTRGSYRCSCKAGYTGNGKTCADIDECSASNPVCDVNANCQNTRGSYVCSCKAGFTGDGKTCTDIDECGASNPVCDVNANCQNTPGFYVCSCKPGFTGDGKTCTDIDECSASNPVCDVNANCKNTDGSYNCSCKLGFTGDGKTCNIIINSCAKIKASEGGKAVSGQHWLVPRESNKFPVFCDMTSDSQGWTLIARFSNNDTKHWMNNSGYWWYDRTGAAGKTTDPLNNTDMISPAFWLTSGNEFKITRSDDSLHTPLLQTTGDCLGGQTFRSKVTSYGDFRNGTVWASDQCQGNCTVQYGGQYQSTDGFQQAACSGDIQSSNAIGFWCDWSGGDGAVLMIGGGGGSCSRADHGVGITETNEASFIEIAPEKEFDFGYEANNPQSESYSLNLWIR